MVVRDICQKQKPIYRSDHRPFYLRASEHFISVILEQSMKILCH